MDAPANIAKKLNLPIARDNPEYAEALAKRSMLKQRIGEVRAAISALQTRISLAAQPLDEAEFGERVKQALASKDASFEPVANIPAARLELAKLKGDQQVLHSAHCEQSRICEEMRDRLSLAALAKIENEHKRTVAAIAQAMDDLRAAALAERDVRRQFHDAGYTADLPSFRVPRLDFFARDWGVGDFAARVGEYLR